MITYRIGNIVESEAQAIVNTVNIVGIMGKGLALQFKESFPENFKIYKEACRKGLFHVGEMLITEARLQDGTYKLIVNFPTKTDWRKPSEYCYIETGLRSLKKEIIQRHITSIAIPPLGSKNGGLDWSRVKVMIERELNDVDCQIFIYEPSDAIYEKLKQERVALTPARVMMLDVMADLVAHGEFMSEFAAEKIVYFLQRFGAKDIFKLSYQRGVYGPYSGKIRYVLRYLNGSYIMGMSDLSKRPFEEIWLTNDAAELAAKMLLLPENYYYKMIADKTKTFLRAFYSNFSLELLSTIDFILQTDSKLKDWKTLDDTDLIHLVTDDIATWNSRKKRIFASPKYVEIMLRHLKETNFCN